MSEAVHVLESCHVGVTTGLLEGNTTPSSPYHLHSSQWRIVPVVHSLTFLLLVLHLGTTSLGLCLWSDEVGQEQSL